jgi:hypothetical protein
MELPLLPISSDYLLPLAMVCFKPIGLKSAELRYPAGEEFNSQVFKILRAASLPVRMDMGTPAGL